MTAAATASNPIINKYISHRFTAGVLLLLTSLVLTGAAVEAVPVLELPVLSVVPVDVPLMLQVVPAGTELLAPYGPYVLL